MERNEESHEYKIPKNAKWYFQQPETFVIYLGNSSRIIFKDYHNNQKRCTYASFFIIKVTSWVLEKVLFLS